MMHALFTKVYINSIIRNGYAEGAEGAEEHGNKIYNMELKFRVVPLIPLILRTYNNKTKQL